MNLKSISRKSYPKHLTYFSSIIRFKKYSLKYHPLKNPNQMRLFLPKFNMICEAYEVLSNQ